MLSQGVVLSDRYLLNERIATGGMGDVWRGTDVLLRREVAVKVLLPSLVSDSDFITRFRAEARIMAALRHPGIVQVYDYGENAVVNGSRLDYLVMEYIEGAPLSKWIKANGKLGITETMSVVTQAAQALHVAHNAGIVHRDIKPSNLLVQPDGTIVLVDFGVAQSANLTSITATNMVVGSAHYMAPEQASGRAVSAATDTYALGAVAYCCLTGRPPFTGDNPIQVVTQHLQDEPPTLPAEIPAPVAALVTRALAKGPANRYPSAAAFADAARAVQSAVSFPPPVGAVPGAGSFPPPMGAVPGAGSFPPPMGAVPGAGSFPPPVGAVPGAGSFPPPMGAVETAAISAPSLPADRLPVVPPPTRGNRRRNVTLVSVAGAVVIGLAILVAMLPGKPKAEGQPPTQSMAKLPAGATASGPVEDTGTATGKPPRPAVTPGKSTPSATAPLTAEPTTTGSPKPTTTPTKAPTSNPYTPVQVCGSGYQVIDSASLTNPDGALRGRVYLLYNASNGFNCVATLKFAALGTPTPMSAYLEVQDRTRSTVSGSYAYYAGPVRSAAAGTCIKWGGLAGGISYNSPFEHCG